MILVGVTFVPKSAAKAMAGKIISQTGITVHYEGLFPRLFLDDVRVTKTFLDLVSEPLALLMVGDVTFAKDVSPDLLLHKVTSIGLVGDASVEDPDLLPMVQFLAQGPGTVRVAS